MFLPLFYSLYSHTDTNLAGCGGRKRGRKTTPRLGGFCHGSVADFKGRGFLPLSQISFFSHPVAPRRSFHGRKVNIWLSDGGEPGGVEGGWKPPVASLCVFVFPVLMEALWQRGGRLERERYANRAALQCQPGVCVLIWMCVCDACMCAADARHPTVCR